MESLADYFTKYIFGVVGVPEDEEIPFESIKKALEEAKGEESEILSLLIGVDNNNANSDIGKRMK